MLGREATKRDQSHFGRTYPQNVPHLPLRPHRING